MFRLDCLHWKVRYCLMYIDNVYAYNYWPITGIIQTFGNDHKRTFDWVPYIDTTKTIWNHHTYTYNTKRKMSQQLIALFSQFTTNIMHTLCSILESRDLYIRVNLFVSIWYVYCKICFDCVCHLNICLSRFLPRVALIIQSLFTSIWPPSSVYFQPS